MFGESSLIGMAAETIARGYDVAAVMGDMVFGSPATDVLDVGSDLRDCETMTSFISTTDTVDFGVVGEDSL
ncbi:hypothetical protein VPNG_03434 [Cytospora leucostoma]|uniref:Uncharacterized protein n=1 Tax=Cytospora leucostoma TaxID=1230097 RepID=A0A423XFE9_9PEZI|nr:hypothetical protein VPNG_03434 [Cytospora leucostoma]